MMEKIFKLCTRVPLTLASFSASILFPLQASAQAQTFNQSTVDLHTPRFVRTLSPSVKRVLFESAPFASGSTVPYWDKGHLISIVPETTTPNATNVRLYDVNGKKVREASVWFPDALTVYLLNAAVTMNGNIIASGTAVKADGTRAYFIAATDSAGKITDVIQTNAFYPANICAASDDTIWSFGDLGLDSNSRPVDGNVLRQFDFRRGLVAGFLPRATLGESIHAPAQRGNEGQEVYFRCQANRLVIYSGVVDQYIEFDTTTNSVTRFRIDQSVISSPVRGFAVVDKGDVFGYLRDYSNPETIQGLFHLDVDAAAGVVRWIPVKGAAGKKGQDGVVQGLWGADGEQLVHGFSNDPSGRWAVSWSLPTAEPSSP